MRSHLLLLLAAAPLAACTTSDSNAVPLASLRGLTVNVTATMGDGSGIFDGIDVRLPNYDNDGDCLEVAVDATINGGAFDLNDNGGPSSDGRPDETIFGPGTEYDCIPPEFELGALPSGPTSIHIADDSATIDVVLPDLTAQRSLSLSGSSALIIGEPVALVPNVLSTDRDAAFSLTATPNVVCDDGISLFSDGAEPAEPPYLPFDIPSGCPDLANMPTDLAFTIEAAPQIATCSGAACTATVSSTHDLNVTFQVGGSD